MKHSKTDSTNLGNATASVLRKIANKGIYSIGLYNIADTLYDNAVKIAAPYCKSLLADNLVSMIYSIEGLSVPEVTVAVRELLYKLDPVKYDKFSTDPVLDESMYTKVKPLDPCTYTIMRRNAKILVHARFVDNQYDNNIKAFRTDIYIIGENRHKYVKLFQKMVNDVKERLSTGQSINVISYGKEGRSTRSRQSKKMLTSMVIKESNRTKIENKINKFINNRASYEEHEINYKLGILLYGDPGTGKTSLAKALASTYKTSLAVLNVNDILEFNNYDFSDARQSDDDLVVVLLEDIDCVLNDDDDREKGGKGTSKLHALLQLLDGTNSTSGVIYVATTNYIDRLDDALTREGRFDLKVEMVNFDAHDAYELGTKFDFSKEDMDNIVEKYDIHYPINPAKLQNYLMDEYLKRIK